MIIKVSSDNISCCIIGRVLHRCKGIDLLAQRKYNDTSRMLSRTPSDSGTSKNDTVNLTFSLSLPTFFKIILYISKSRLISQCSDRSGPECLSGSEDDFRILVRVTLLIT